HTRSLRDWSSDVCSSDLTGLHVPEPAHPETGRGDQYGDERNQHQQAEPDHGDPQPESRTATQGTLAPGPALARRTRSSRGDAGQIGRASCRERVEIWVWG